VSFQSCLRPDQAAAARSGAPPVPRTPRPSAANAWQAARAPTCHVIRGTRGGERGGGGTRGGEHPDEEGPGGVRFDQRLGPTARVDACSQVKPGQVRSSQVKGPTERADARASRPCLWRWAGADQALPNRSRSHGARRPRWHICMCVQRQASAGVRPSVVAASVAAGGAVNEWR
jgi:hypothetical protein